MFYKKVFTLLAVAIMFVASNCAAKSEVIDAEEVVPQILSRTDTYARYFIWSQADLKMDIIRPVSKEKTPNPITYINKNTPPFLIFHGNKDTTISPSQSKILYNALIKNNVAADYYVIKGGEHYLKYFYQPKTFKIIVDFLNRTLK